MTLAYADLQKYNVFRTPDWRYDRVCRLVDRYPTPGRASRRDDRYVRAARVFLLQYRSRDEDARGSLVFDNPGLYFAYTIQERAAGPDPEPAQFIQARLLARQTTAEIADCLGTLPETVEWYEALFFNVADRLDNRDWITKHVLLPAILHQQGLDVTPREGEGEVLTELRREQRQRGAASALPYFDGTLKLFAYFGGRYLVDVLLTGFEAGKPLTSADGMGEWFDRCWSTTVRRRSAQAALQFEVNRHNVMEFFAIHAKIIEIEKSEESQQNTRTQQESHVRALVESLPFVVGAAGQAALAGTQIARFDESAVELRGDELLRAGHGEDMDALAAEVGTLSLPAPRHKRPNLEREVI